MGVRASLPVVLLLLTASSVRADEEPTLVAVDTLLTSPLKSEREDGLRRLVAAGSAGLEAARGWLEAPDPALRIGAWRALGALGEAEDLDAALIALEVPDEAEADAAARAVLQMAARLTPRATPPLRDGTLSRRGARALQTPVADLLRRSTPDEVPVALLRLGGGIVPVLARLARSEDRGYRPRDEAIDALAALGGSEARRALAGLLPRRGDVEGRILRALRHVARGPGLEEAWASALNAMGSGRTRLEAALFLQSCPPGGVDLEQRKKILAAAVRGAGRGPRAGVAVEQVRVFLALGPPDDEQLEKLIGSVNVPSNERTWVLLALEPFKDRPPVRRGLEAMEERGDLPPAMDGWVRLLLGTSDAAQLAALARAAVEAPVTSEGPDARRLGLLLLTRLPGRPPETAVRLGLEDDDSWSRACALSLVERFPETSPLAALARALAADRDLWVMEAAAELSCVPWDAALRARLADALLSGPRDLRTRIVSLLARREGTAVPPGLPESIATASIDVRLRLAARLLADPGDR